MPEDIDPSCGDSLPLAAFSLEPLDDKCVVVVVGGELDISNTGELGDLLSQAQALSPQVLVVDLTAVSFCSSTSLGVLINASAAAKTAGTRFGLVAPHRPVQRPIEVLNLGPYLPVHNSVNAARRSLS
ncbi:STAS domain-containing protein [Amycolatopsis sp. 195334CR]|uniref:STAS domain-containing protein n=1 Tax=Amycolatopsis sp. 195334CR TaxID=2814588 RepID=UPI001A8DE981|nr:STAS domain-containing protein [Amycolatopsis sp. 195334CR]MBN6038531.1 STAS domain-containing protein [Amycolatopsis sp. 195334CR]